ncbi:MAG: zinc ABC transporter substrate-binding protein [Phycisphaerae bacterium]|nr:zinc ABC transporter substrate-binding protein [Phycisphaerae bacterium]
MVIQLGWNLLAVVLGVVLALTAGCDRRTASRGDGRINVVCTTGMVADLVTRVGGERVAVTCLMGEGVDPHLYKASPGDLRLLENADLIFYNGLHLEGRMGEVLETLGRRQTVVAVAEGIDAAKLLVDHDQGGQPDPHIWFDVMLWMKAAERVRGALITRDPESAPTYERNTAEYLARLTALHEEVAREVVSIPAESRVLVTAHDAFGYFGRAYGIEVRAVQGMSTDSEASLKDINDLVDLLCARRIKAVFIESSVSAKSVEALVEGCRARGHEVVIGGELFSDAMGAPGTPEGTYEGMVRANVSLIVGALR